MLVGMQTISKLIKRLIGVDAGNGIPAARWLSSGYTCRRGAALNCPLVELVSICLSAV